MHQYLKAIGFGPIKKKAELKEILEQTRETFTHQMTVSYNEEADYCEFQKEYGQDVGITLCGELDDHDQFDMEYYFPYFQGSGVTTYADVSIEKRIEREQYVGICEDAKIGITIIFYLQNVPQYLKEKQWSGNKMNYTYERASAGYDDRSSKRCHFFRSCSVRENPAACKKKRDTDAFRKRGSKNTKETFECCP